jgi:ribonucleoside-diphosphate reductase alpha chain
MKLERKHTTPGQDPLDQVKYEKRTSVIANPDGSEVFRMDDAEVPADWSQLATDIMVSKYFRKRGVPKTGHEVSARQVVHRIARTIRSAGEDLGGYFDTIEDADTFEAELSHHLIHQMGAFNSPVWFNCGLNHEYGIKGSGGNWYWDRKRERILETKDSYSHPQCSACYIQSVEDDTMAIFDLLKNEARLFKFGSGTGTNFSKIRGSMEKLSGGGVSSGLMSFLEVLDRGAGAIKSGGTTRRAAKMVSLDMDHPEIEDFIGWKAKEEKKVAALMAAGYSSDFNGEAYQTVSGQNSNNSVRISDEFMKAYLDDGEWSTRLRTTGEIHKTYKAKDLMNKISEAAWACADPGVQYDTTINNWHTSANTDRINGSNPCSEYMFLDDSACNLSSINLMKFFKEDGHFDIDGFRYACKIFFIAQEILVGFASYPTKKIAQNSHDYRPLGLGFANLGTLLMVLGLPYDSEEGRAICSAITAVMCGHAYVTSAQMAADKGPFAGYDKNRDPMLRVMNMHRDAAYQIAPDACPADLLAAAKEDWDLAVELGTKFGYRNAQATVVAPTGTIGLLMDCDTTGIEPDFALVKFKKLSGGGYFKIVNLTVPRALQRLGYSEDQIEDIIAYICGTLTFQDTPHINRKTLSEKGFTTEDLQKVEASLPGVFELSYAFMPWALGEETMSRLGFTPDQYNASNFELLQALGFTKPQIDEANDVVCGQMTVEGAPHLQDKHLPVFDCANKCGKRGKRYIAPFAHITMMSAAQEFICGAISKTVNVPTETTSREIEALYVEGWRLGLKAIAIYRDGSKLSQPLSTSSSRDKEGAEAHTPEEDSAAALVSQEAIPAGAAKEDLTLRGVERRLPSKRGGFTQEARVAGQKIFLRTGEYEDGTLGEIFIDMHKEGAPFRSILNCFAIAISKGLKYGVPLEEYVETFTFTRFEPWGTVDHPNIKFSTSVIDYVFRVLGYEYQGRTDFLQVKPEDIASDIDDHHDLENEMVASNQNAAEKETTQVPPLVPKPEATTAEPGPVAVGGETQKNGINGARPGLPATGGPSSAQAAQKDDHQHQTQTMVLDEQLSHMMGDAPFCDTCGHITVRNGSCYRCLNCGNSVGCS